MNSPLTPDGTRAREEPPDWIIEMKQRRKKRRRELKEKRNKLIRILCALLPSAVYPADRVKQKCFITPHIPDNITVAPLHKYKHRHFIKEQHGSIKHTDSFC